MMRHRSASQIVLLSTLLALAGVAGCAAPDAATSETSTDDVVTSTLMKKYGMTVGVVATDAKARAPHNAIVASGGTDLGNHSVMAGLTGAELGATDDDADESFGITCQAAEGDSTFGADTCSLHAVIEMGKQEGAAAGSVVLSGKLAKAVASALPRTSPEGLVGSVQTGSGPVSCKSIPGPAGATCTVKSNVMVATFHELVSGDDEMPAKDAKAIIKMFFPD
jgi:hypothetical protein